MYIYAVTMLPSVCGWKLCESLERTAFGEIIRGSCYLWLFQWLHELNDIVKETSSVCIIPRASLKYSWIILKSILFLSFLIRWDTKKIYWLYKWSLIWPVCVYLSVVCFMSHCFTVTSRCHCRSSRYRLDYLRFP